MSKMNIEQFTKIMKTLKQKMGEANWTPPKTFVPYLDLYEKILNNEINERPKLDGLLNELLENNKINDKTSSVVIDILELELGKIKVMATAMIEVPGIIFSDYKWIAATPLILLEIGHGENKHLDFFLKYFFTIPAAGNALVELAEMNGIHVIKNDLELVRSFTYVTETEESIMICWRFDEDMDLNQIMQMRATIFNTFKKVYHEIKYGLGL